MRQSDRERIMFDILLVGYMSSGYHTYALPSCSCLRSRQRLVDPCFWGAKSDLPACGPPATFSVHLTSSALTPAGSVHTSRGDNVVRMWVQLKR